MHKGNGQRNTSTETSWTTNVAKLSTIPVISVRPEQPPSSVHTSQGQAKGLASSVHEDSTNY